jgi:hypothetical protein
MNVEQAWFPANLLLSDGASRFEDLFELATWEELQALLGENGLDEHLAGPRRRRRRRGPAA